MRDVGTWKHSWGEVVLPKCCPKLETDQVAMTLSLWDDLESVVAFSHHGAHGGALANRKDWFQSLGLPTYVAWWVPTDHRVEPSHRYWGPSSAFGAVSDAERSRAGSSRIAYPVRADMMDPPMVRSSEPA